MNWTGMHKDSAMCSKPFKDADTSQGSAWKRRLRTLLLDSGLWKMLDREQQVPPATGRKQRSTGWKVYGQEASDWMTCGCGLSGWFWTSMMPGLRSSLKSIFAG